MAGKKTSERRAPSSQTSPEAIRLVLVVLALALLVGAVALTRPALFAPRENGSAAQPAVQPDAQTAAQAGSEAPAPQATPEESTDVPLEALMGQTDADLTTGIILGGAVLVLIVIGGTLGATRRAQPPKAH